MDNSNKIWPIYFSLLPAILLLIFSIISGLEEEGCSGMLNIVSFFLSALFMGFLALWVFIFVITQLIRIYRKRPYIRHRATTVLLNLVLAFMAACLPGYINEHFGPTLILEANHGAESNDIASIILYTNGTYRATYGHIDWSCRFVDNYSIHGDTVYLYGNVIDRSDSILSSAYLIRGAGLYPLDKQVKEYRKPQVLLITQQENN